MKTAILIHGRHVHSTDWEQVEWGNPAKGTYGNIPKGLVEALLFDADTIIFGTGSSEKAGLKEGEYALKFAHDRILEIPEFQTMGTEEAREWLNARALIELTAQNTTEEVIAGARLAKERGAERLIQVACRTHSVRAYKTALIALQADASVQYLLRNFYSIASDTSYEDGDIDAVVIVEPPHRPDRPKVFLNKTLAAAVAHMNDPRAAELNDGLQHAIDEYRALL